jgi:peptidoglycan/xylan/chitin deacetylase (PgdA/CDA1 family)
MMRRSHRQWICRTFRLTALVLLFAGCVRLLAGGFPFFSSSVPADSGLVGVEATPSATPSPSDTQQPKLIALTFDDGPRRSTTTALLDGLAERGVQATFFLIGAQVENNRDVVQRMDQEGHQIGIHTYDHVKLTDLNQADFDAQVARTRTLLEEILGHNHFLLRPPYGMLDESVKQWAQCPIILWSIDPEDWKDQNTAREVEQIVSQAKDGSIILMHDIFPASVDAALQVVDALHQQGYLFCTVEDLFAARGITLEDGTMYWNAYP